MALIRRVTPLLAVLASLGSACSSDSKSHSRSSGPNGTGGGSNQGGAAGASGAGTSGSSGTGGSPSQGGAAGSGGTGAGTGGSGDAGTSGGSDTGGAGADGGSDSGGAGADGGSDSGGAGASGGAGSGGIGGTAPGGMGGSSGGSGGGAGSAGVTYYGCSYVGGLDRVTVRKHDAARNLCLLLELAAPMTSSASELTLPPNWGVNRAIAFWPATAECAGSGAGQNRAQSTVQTGSVSWTSMPQLWADVATFDVVMTFTPVTGGVEASELLRGMVSVRDTCR